MEILIIGLVIGAIAWLVVRSKSQTAERTTNTRKPAQDDDYEIWLNIIKDRNSNIRELNLFGTKAAVLWNDGHDEAEVICITAFRNSVPITKKRDHFSFNIKEEYWVGQQPKGASARIREQIKAIDLT